MLTGATHYVDTITTGSGDGTSWTNAFKNFKNINWTSFNPGDTLFVSGTSDTTQYYDTLQVLKSGTLSGKIVITIGKEIGHNGYAKFRRITHCQYSRDHIVFDGVNKNFIFEADSSSELYMYDVDSIIIRNIEFRGGKSSASDQHGISIGLGVKALLIENCYIRGSMGDGINININDSVVNAKYLTKYGKNYNVIVNNCIIDSLRDDCIQVSNSYVLIDSTFMRYVDSTHGGIPPGAAHPDLVQINPDNGGIDILNCTFVNGMQSVFAEKTRGDCVVANNVFYDEIEMNRAGNTNRSLSINKSTKSWYGTFYYCNNVMHGIQWACYFIGNPQLSSTDLVIKNNIHLNNVRTVVSESLWDSVSIDRANNVFSINADSCASCNAAPVGSVTGNPLFANHIGRDYTISNTLSSACRIGYDMSAIYTTDKNGTLRTGWDAGAYFIPAPAFSAERKMRCSR